jgi:hypothetical protein
MQSINSNDRRKENDFSRAKQAREQLKALSKAAKLLVQGGIFDNVNEAIIETVYNDKQNHTFKTFNQWISEGYKIIKGSKAYPIWAKPKKGQNHTEGEKDEYKFFPICYLFSNTQVTKGGEIENLN